MENLQDKTTASSVRMDVFNSSSVHLELWKVHDEDWDSVKLFTF